MTLKKRADLTEVQYWIGVLKKRDFMLKELLDLYQKASITLMILMLKLGKFNLFDSIIKDYQKPSESESEQPEKVHEFKITVANLFIRCQKTYDYTNTVITIFKDFKKHKTAYQTLLELGNYINNPGFNVVHT